jgi:general secretion pathway protein G
MNSPIFPFHASFRSRSIARRRAFTLVELLAVIAIIGVLAAIILPVVNRVRKAARSAVCIKNLQNIGVAFQLYAADNRDLFPAPRFRSDSVPITEKNRSEKNWNVEIAPYLARSVATFSKLSTGADTYAFCPEYVLLYKNHPKFGDGGSTGGYGMCTRINGSTTDNYDRRFAHARINVPSCSILVADSDRYFFNVTSSGWAKNTEEDKPGEYTSCSPERHGTRANYLFADGHVKSLDPDTALATYNTQY